MKSDILVIGAGPAGSAAAIVLARAGVDVLLADRHEFPRDKTCGDALLPDAIRALDDLGLLGRVLEVGLPLGTLSVHSPGNHRAEIRGRFASIPRRALDDLLRSEAVRSGARFLAPFRADRPLTSGDAIRGARLSGPGGRSVDAEAVVTILASGAAPGPLGAFGVSSVPAPDAFALRAYFEAPPDLAEEHRELAVVYARRICPAYGWVFALPGRRFNVGAGWIRRRGSADRPPHQRRLWQDFIDAFPDAGDLARCAGSRVELSGAPIRTSFGMDPLGRRGLLVAGEAAGLTYPFTGEGIGKAIDSGMLAASTILKRLSAPSGDLPGVHADYARAARSTYGPRFETYRRAQQWVASPRLCDLLCRRAAHEGWVRRQVEGMIAETVNPRALFSPWGLVRALAGA